MYQSVRFLATNRTTFPLPPNSFNIGYATEDTYSLNNHKAEVGLALAMVFQGSAQFLLILLVQLLLYWLHSEVPGCSFLSQHNIPSEKKADYKTKGNYPCLLSRNICQFLFVFSSRWTLQLAYQFSYNILLDVGSIILNL